MDFAHLHRGVGIATVAAFLVTGIALLALNVAALPAGAFCMEPMHTRQFGVLSGIGIQLLFWGSISYAIAVWREATAEAAVGRNRR